MELTFGIITTAPAYADTVIMANLAATCDLMQEWSDPLMTSPLPLVQSVQFGGNKSLTPINPNAMRGVVKVNAEKEAMDKEFVETVLDAQLNTSGLTAYVIERLNARKEALKHLKKRK